MAYWLFKSEPHLWSWEMQKARGLQGEEWSGVRNYAARNAMCTMQKGEKGFFYHSHLQREIVGIVEICQTAHQDSTSADPRWRCVDICAVCDLPTPVSLQKIKKHSALQHIALVKQPRLSVQPVPKEAWYVICQLGGLNEKDIFALEQAS